MTQRCLLAATGWLLAALLIAVSLRIFSNPILPSPAALLARLSELLAGPLWPDLLLTCARSLLAFTLALISGILWAAFFPPRTRRAELAVPTLLLLQAAPVILWIVPLVLLMGTGHAAPVAAAILVVMPLIAFEFRTAFEMTSRDRREFWRHYVPVYRKRIALRLHYEWRPYLASATGMGLLMSFKASVIAEWFAARNGIGRQLQQAFVLVDTASFLAYALSFLVAALVLSTWAGSQMGRPWLIGSAETSQVRTGAKRDKVSLELRHISYRFGQREILRDITMHLRGGEIAILTGGSGTGKSTLAKLAAGVLRPQQGNLIRPAADVCLVFQPDFLFPAETVAANVAFFLANGAAGAAENAILEVGLTGDTKAGDLSGGMRRRLAIARGLVANARYLILDEPFTGLDTGAIGKLTALLAKKARAGYGILIITHSLTPMLRKAAKRVYKLQDGRLS